MLADKSKLNLHGSDGHDLAHAKCKISSDNRTCHDLVLYAWTPEYKVCTLYYILK